MPYALDRAERSLDATSGSCRMNLCGTQAPPIARLVAHLISVDGVVDDAELAVAHQALARFEITPEQLRSALNSVAKATPREFVSALDEVPAENREAAASLIFEVASADERMDRREAELLDAMREAWGVSVAFLNKPIEWDEEQQLIIEADPSDKLLVSAGPGMGKTSVACSRVAYLVDRENVTDSNIWLVSFTRAAVRRQGFWDKWRADLAEALAHLGCQSRRLPCGEASAAG